MTPLVLEKVVWAGANLGSYRQAAAAIRELLEIDRAPKQLQRITSRVGDDCLEERRRAVEEHRDRPLMERVAAPAGVDAPDFPAWLAGAEVVAELAKLAAREEEVEETATDDFAPVVEGESEAFDWRELTPELLSREVIASGEEAEDFGRHLEWKAWTHGAFAANRQAFVADGLAVNWTTHKQHFSQSTPILDLMHALSYAWRAAVGLGDMRLYRRWAEWIWQGLIERVIGELKEHRERIGAPPPDASASDPRERLARDHLLHEPQRKDALSGIPPAGPAADQQPHRIDDQVARSAVAGRSTPASRVPRSSRHGAPAGWNETSGNAVLQLRADSLSDIRPLDSFWTRWRNRQTSINAYRKLAT